MLGVTVVVALRLLYGWMRVVHAWTSSAGDGAWLSQAGAEGSFAAGALVLGYYFTWWAGVHRRVAAHRAAFPARRRT